MNTLTVALAQSLVVAALLAVPSRGQDDEALKKDLAAVIALHGMPCGQVVDVKLRAESDYAATCKDGTVTLLRYGANACFCQKAS